MGNLVKKTQMTTGGPVFVYVDEEEDKIIRITPMDLDEDDYANFLTGRTASCPFYRFGDEYLIVHKQI